MSKKWMLFLIPALLLTGCVHHQSGYRAVPSAVPEKWLTKTAEAGSASVLPDLSMDIWQQCALSGNGNISLAAVQNLQPEEYSRRVRITFAIQDDRLQTATIMQRCMNGKVYVCLAGIGDHCAEKIDFSVEVNELMEKTCADEAFEGMTLPPAVLGRTSAYEWVCHDGQPVITQQIIETDAAGYDKAFWFEIPAPED